MDNINYYSKLHLFLEQHEAIWQASVVESDGSTPAKPGMKLAIPLNGEPFGNLGGGEMEHQVIALVRSKKPMEAQLLHYSLSDDDSEADLGTSMICGGSVKVYLEALHMVNKLYIIGAGHCGKALGQLAKLCGYYVCLVDNRSEILQTDLRECCHEAIYNDFNDLSQTGVFSPEHLLVIMTHGHLHDRQVLQQCLGKPLKYLGMIGSKRKVAETFSMLKEQGFQDTELAKCHAPVGLPIGSQTPFEIAVSIMAEIISLHKQPKQK